MIIPENVDKLYTGINGILVYSMQGENGDFLMHIYEGVTLMVDVCKKNIIRNRRRGFLQLSAGIFTDNLSLGSGACFGFLLILQKRRYF